MAKVTVYFKERNPTPEGNSRAFTFEGARLETTWAGSATIFWGEETWTYPFEVIQGIRTEND